MMSSIYSQKLRLWRLGRLPVSYHRGTPRRLALPGPDSPPAESVMWVRQISPAEMRELIRAANDRHSACQVMLRVPIEAHRSGKRTVD
jgi:hypothetical protein